MPTGRPASRGRGDEYGGAVRVKVGPITAEYKGTARFIERNGTAHRAVLRAEGRETRGQANAGATITATLKAAGTSTEVSVVIELTVAGKLAQFGRGVLADVSNKLMSQFVSPSGARAVGLERDRGRILEDHRGP